MSSAGGYCLQSPTRAVFRQLSVIFASNRLFPASSFFLVLCLFSYGGVSKIGKKNEKKK